MVPDPLPLAYAVGPYAFINVDNCERPLTFIAPIVRQRSAHQCFVLSRVGSNENIVRLSSDSDDLKKNPAP